MDGMSFGQRSRPSSNAYASGSNQNCGNVLSDTPTTRVARPPGGHSSISLGWDDGSSSAPQNCQSPLGRRGPPQVHHQSASSAVAGTNNRRAVSSNAFACGSNQNCGNSLSDISSTRVRQPPGGASSLSLGFSAPSSGGYASYEAQAPYPPQPPSPSQGSFGSRGSPRSPPMSPNGSRPINKRTLAVPGAPAAAAQRMQQESSWQSPASPSQCHQDSRRPPSGDSFGTRPRVSGNAYATGSNQNCGNVLTGVPSTRVNRPPGGTTSLSLSWDDTDAQAKDYNRRPPAGYVDPRRGSPAAEPSMSSSGRFNNRADQAREAEGAFGVRPRVSSNTFACGSDQNCGNMLSDTPSTRVSRPPGGASTFSLAWD